MEPWQKPKWMRWDTFSRLVLAGRAAQDGGDRIDARQARLGRPFNGSTGNGERRKTA
jgi:hypothetical protein